MSVLIKGMEMPNSCYLCCFYNGLGCKATGKMFPMFSNVAIRREDCPIVEIHPHGRLIDADEISEHKYATLPPYRKEYADGKPKSEEEVIAFKFGWNNAIDAITENAPTIIEAEEGE